MLLSVKLRIAFNFQIQPQDVSTDSFYIFIMKILQEIKEDPRLKLLLLLSGQNAHFLLTLTHDLAIFYTPQNASSFQSASRLIGLQC